MSILNRPSDGLVSVLIALCKALVAYGPLSDDDLIDLVAPASVGSTDMSKKTLSRWKQLGAFVVDAKGRTTLTPTLLSVSGEHIDPFREAVLDLVLDPENNTTISGSRDDEHEASRASDLTRALSWVLAQNPYSFPTTWSAVEALQNEQGVEPTVFVNDTRWGGFGEWSVFLGFCVSTQRHGVTVNPAFPLRVAVRRILPSGDIGIRDLISALGGIIPVFDGGQYRSIVDAQTVRPWQTLSPHQVSPSLSIALLTLEAEGTVRLELRSDAPSSALLGRGGREFRTASHVVIGGTV